MYSQAEHCHGRAKFSRFRQALRLVLFAHGGREMPPLSLPRSHKACKVQPQASLLSSFSVIAIHFIYCQEFFASGVDLMKVCSAVGLNGA